MEEEVTAEELDETLKALEEWITALLRRSEPNPQLKKARERLIKTLLSG